MHGASFGSSHTPHAFVMTIHSARHVRRLMKQLKVNARRPESDLMVIESAIRVRVFFKQYS